MIVLVARALGVDSIYPDQFETSTTVYDANIQSTILGWLNDALDYVQDPSSFIFGITDPVGNFILEKLLQPVQNLLMDTPWFIVIGCATALAFVLSGLRPAITAFADAASLIGFLGVWEPAMDTASQVLVATAIAVLIGIAIGIWAAESPRVEKALRPILDTLQTLPQLVYIIPFIYLMPVSLVPGVVAAVLYAAPVVIRLVDAPASAAYPPAPVEAADAFGASSVQMLAKVKVPLARDSIMLGVNQGLIMVLAVVVIGGLVGSGALGDQVARGLQRNEFGEGVVASIAILALGIALDRVTQGRRESSTRRRGSLKTHRTLWAVAMALMLALFVAACGSSKDDDDSGGSSQSASGKDCGKVVLNEQAWAGSTANTYIAKNVLEDKLGCKVEITKIAEIPVFQAHGGRQGRRRARGLAARRPVQAVHRQGRHRRPGRAARRRGPHRLVHPEVPDGRSTPSSRPGRA